MRKRKSRGVPDSVESDTEKRMVPPKRAFQNALNGREGAGESSSVASNANVYLEGPEEFWARLAEAEEGIDEEDDEDEDSSNSEEDEEEGEEEEHESDGIDRREFEDPSDNTEFESTSMWTDSTDTKDSTSVD